MSQSPKPNPSLQVQIDDQTAMGQYSNFMLVNHNENEFVLDFAYAFPGPPRAKVGSRIILSPRHMKRVLEALQTNIKKYEERFGPIKPLETDWIPYDSFKLVFVDETALPVMASASLAICSVDLLHDETIIDQVSGRAGCECVRVWVCVCARARVCVRVCACARAWV